MCLNYILPVPASLGGDIKTDADLEALSSYETGFPDPGQFVVVLGWDKISNKNGVTIGGLGDWPPPPMYFHYWGGSPIVGMRLATHEMGHVIGLPAAHTACNQSPHDFFHANAFSSVRHGTCPASLYLAHRHMNTWYGIDSGIMTTTHEQWCAARKGSSCV